MKTLAIDYFINYIFSTRIINNFSDERSDNDNLTHLNIFFLHQRTHNVLLHLSTHSQLIATSIKTSPFPQKNTFLNYSKFKLLDFYKFSFSFYIITKQYVILFFTTHTIWTIFKYTPSYATAISVVYICKQKLIIIIKERRI